MSGRVATLLFTIGLFVGGVVMYACTPAERKELAPVVVPAERAVCVILRVEGVGDLCPTADELAPFAAQMLAFQVARPLDAPPPKPIARLPSVRAARARACVPATATLDGGDDGGITTPDEGGTSARPDRRPREDDASAPRVDGGDRPLDGGFRTR